MTAGKISATGIPVQLWPTVTTIRIHLANAKASEWWHAISTNMAAPHGVLGSDTRCTASAFPALSSVSAPTKPPGTVIGRGFADADSADARSITPGPGTEHRRWPGHTGRLVPSPEDHRGARNERKNCPELALRFLAS